VQTLASGDDRPSATLPETDLSVVGARLRRGRQPLPLHQQLVAASRAAVAAFEVVYVDDGSQDASFEELRRIARRTPRRIVQLPGNFGQPAALTAGIDHAAGTVLCWQSTPTSDDPPTSPSLLGRLEGGYDVVSRLRRRARTTSCAPSCRGPPRVISRVTGRGAAHDYPARSRPTGGRAPATSSSTARLHRFIPALLAQVGARVAEVRCSHRPRQRGRSKYGMCATP